MAEYEIFFKESVWKDLKEIPEKDLKRILSRIESLGEEPRPAGGEKLTGQELYRARQGNYRILYSIQDNELTIWVIKVGHRKEVYRRSEPACAGGGEEHAAPGTRRYEIGKSVMTFSEVDLQRIKKLVGDLCDRRTPEELRDKLRFEYEIEKQNVIVHEVRPVWDNPSEYMKLPMAKLSFVKRQKLWKLYWKRASGKWEKYQPNESDKDLGMLIKEIDKDAFGCFFG